MENLTNDTPPKRGFRHPLVRYVFHPPQASALCFSCTKIHARADQKLFWRGPKIFGRARSLVRFPPPHTFCTPPYHRPKFRVFFYFLRAKFETELRFVSREKEPEFRRKRDSQEPLLTAMAQVLPLLSFIGLETKGLLDFQGRRGVASVVRWKLRPVKFGVD